MSSHIFVDLEIAIKLSFNIYSEIEVEALDLQELEVK